MRPATRSGKPSRISRASGGLLVTSTSSAGAAAGRCKRPFFRIANPSTSPLIAGPPCGSWGVAEAPPPTRAAPAFLAERASRRCRRPTCNARNSGSAGPPATIRMAATTRRKAGVSARPARPLQRRSSGHPRWRRCAAAIGVKQQSRHLDRAGLALLLRNGCGRLTRWPSGRRLTAGFVPDRQCHRGFVGQSQTPAQRRRRKPGEGRRLRSLVVEAGYAARHVACSRGSCLARAAAGVRCSRISSRLVSGQIGRLSGQIGGLQ